MMEDAFAAMVRERVGGARWNEISDAPTYEGMQFEHRIDLLLDEAFRPGEYSVGHGLLLSRVKLILSDEDHVHILLKYL